MFIHCIYQIHGVVLHIECWCEMFFFRLGLYPLRNLNIKITLQIEKKS